MARVRRPAQTYWVADNTDFNVLGSAFYANYFYMGYNVYRHHGGLNILWVDGHVAWLSTEESVVHGFYNYIYYPTAEDWWDID
jgi:prepilin-type processing-associated H-X9-DG protein